MKKLFVVFFATIVLFSIVSCQDDDDYYDDDDDDSDIENQYACDACGDVSCLDSAQCAPNPDTCNQYQDYGVLNDDDKQLILQKHNELRQKVASGDQENQPSATNMYELEWDDKLAIMAQCFANNCQFRHIDCNYTEDPDGFGQNIDVLLTDYQVQYDELDYDDDVQDWYDEVEYFPSNLVDGYLDGGNGTYDGGDFGHYTQLVWGISKKIGCGSSLYYKEDEDRWYSLLFCNYAPAGNYETDPLYEKGEPASNCENGPSDDYPALCKN